MLLNSTLKNDMLSENDFAKLYRLPELNHEEKKLALQ